MAETDNADSVRGLLVAIGFFTLVGGAILKTDFPAVVAPRPPTTPELARSLLDDYLLAFEVTSLLLLAAVVGAVVLARRRDPAPESEVLPR